MKFTFYFGGELIHASDDYQSYVDDNLGGEGFTLSHEYSAHTLPAEKTFQIYYTPGNGDNDIEYQIKNFNIN